MKRRLFLITTGFTISFVLVAALSLISISRFSLLVDTTAEVDRGYKALGLLANLETSIRDVDRYERGYLITRDSAFLQFAAPVKQSFDSAMRELRRISGKRMDQQNKLVMLRADMVRRFEAAAENIRLAETDSQRQVNLSAFYRSRAAMEQCLGILKTLRERENADLSVWELQRRKMREVASIAIRTLSLVLGFLTLLLFVLMLREFRKRLRYSDQLQQKMAELQRTHNELEQIAFATSHDLQEPLRKIRIFIDRLKYLRRSGSAEDSTDTLDRISAATNRMQDLVGDLSALTSLVNTEEPSQPVSLQMVISDVEKTLTAKVVAKEGTIHADDLPILPGYPSQLRVLFNALLDNALKFSRDGVPPVIHVTCEQATPDELRELDARLVHTTARFYCISVADNGIGFDNKLAEKMFGIFRRLHNRQEGYEGRGIGLAICQRVMSNHGGYIAAHGHSNSGATFKLYFPAD